jgi:hypothetical protein
MVPACYENLQQINDLCRQLVRFVEAAHLSEAEGRGGILEYSFISACASEIWVTAEERRQILARTQWEHVTDEDRWDLHGMERTELVPNQASQAQKSR